MLNIWHDISPKRITPDDFYAVIEISKGDKNKYELDKETGLLKLDRVLFTSTHYPANYGFIPRTYADDGDPLDVLVLCSETILPMTLVECKPIGMLNMIDGDSKDEKIIAVPLNDPNYSTYNDIKDLPKHVFDEIKHFFSVYKSLEKGKETSVAEVSGVKKAKHRDPAGQACGIAAAQRLAELTLRGPGAVLVGQKAAAVQGQDPVDRARVEKDRAEARPLRGKPGHKRLFGYVCRRKHVAVRQRAVLRGHHQAFAWQRADQIGQGRRSRTLKVTDDQPLIALQKRARSRKPLRGGVEAVVEQQPRLVSGQGRLAKAAVRVKAKPHAQRGLWRIFFLKNCKIKQITHRQHPFPVIE